MKEHLLALDPLNPNLGAGEMAIVNIILALVMFGVALGIKVETFKDVFRQPKSIIVGILMQWVALPAVTCAVALLLNPIITPMVAIGMLLVASCPGGNISNFMSSYAKGNIELSVSMTAVTTAFAPIVTPINFWAWGTLYCKLTSINNEIPTLVIPFGDMFEQIMLLLGLPIVLGIAFAHYFPNATKRLMKPSQILSIILSSVWFSYRCRRLSQLWRAHIRLLHQSFALLLWLSSTMAVRSRQAMVAQHSSTYLRPTAVQ